MIACYAWTNYTIINVTNAKANLYADQQGDLYIRMGAHVSKELIAAIRKSGVFRHVYCLDPIAINYRKLRFGRIRGLRALFLKEALLKAYAAMLGRIAPNVAYERVVLPWFYAESVFCLEYWSRFSPEMKISFIEEGTSSYCYSKKEMCFSLFNAGTFKAKVKRYLTEGTLAKKFAQKVDSICLYRPDLCRSDIDFEKLQLPAVKKQTNPVVFSILENALGGVDYSKIIRYEKKNFVYFSSYNLSDKSFDSQSTAILDRMLSCTGGVGTITKVHTHMTAHAQKFALEFEEKGAYVDRDKYLFESLYANLTRRERMVLVSCASTATITPKFMFDEEPYVIFTYRLYNGYRQCGVERDDWLANIVRDAYTDKSRVLVPNSMDEFNAIIRRLYTQQMFAKLK